MRELFARLRRYMDRRKTGSVDDMRAIFMDDARLRCETYHVHLSTPKCKFPPSKE